MARKINGRQDFIVNRDRLRQICLTAYTGWDERLRIHLPQWNLPSELGNDPSQTLPTEPYLASLFLWTEAFLERMTRSSAIVKNALRVWKNPETNWIFHPRKVAQRSLEDIDGIIRGELKFGLQGIGEEPPQKRYFDNAVLLSGEYDSDPRNLINFRTVDKAREHIRRFKGIGSGIASLFIIYLMEREIASPLDPRNALLKVDVHKGRVPINCGAVTPAPGEREIARSDKYCGVMEREYWTASDSENLGPIRLDSSLWVIGSRICNRRNYLACGRECPLFNLCGGYVPEDKAAGRYRVLDEAGLRIDTRRNRQQGVFGLASL